MAKKWLMSASFFLVAITTMTNAHAVTEIAGQVIDVQSPQLQKYSSTTNTASGFMAIENNGVQNHVLIAVYTPIDKQTILQKAVVKNGQTQMKTVKQILIPAKESTYLKFDGLQVTFLGINKQLAPNSTVPLTLIFDDGSSLIVPATVA